MAVHTYSLRRDGEKRLSPHFKVKEFRCKDGSDTILIDTNLVGLLETVRAKCGNRPLNITSAYRNKSHNQAVGGATRSQHLYGRAADFYISGRTHSYVQSVCKNLMRSGGLGFGRTFTHIDVRENNYLVTFNY